MQRRLCSESLFHRIRGTNCKSQHCIHIDLLNRLPAILDDNKVQVDLPKPPIGEGRSYQVDRKELRPTLLWSIESGWTFLLCESKGNFRSCVHLSISLKIDTGRILHLNIPTQDPPSEGLAELKPRHGDELKKIHNNPIYDDKLLDIIQRKDMSYRFDQLPGTHNNLNDSIQLLCETDGGKQCASEVGINLRVGRTEKHPEVTVNSEHISRNALHSICDVARDEPKDVSNYSLSYNLGVSHQEKRQEMRNTHMPQTMGPTFPVIAISYEVVRNDSMVLALYDW